MSWLNGVQLYITPGLITNGEGFQLDAFSNSESSQTLSKTMHAYRKLSCSNRDLTLKALLGRGLNCDLVVYPGLYF